MNKLTHSELAALITARPGAFPVGILAETDARLLKTGNPNKSVKKTVRTVGFVGANYQKAVRREGERQGAEQAENFVAKPRPWGEWVKGAEGKIATHKGQFYLRTQSTPGQRERARTKVLNYRGENGQFLKFEEVKPFLPAKSYSTRQADVGIEGEGQQINVNEYGFSSLKKVRIAGKTYVIEN